MQLIQGNVRLVQMKIVTLPYITLLFQTGDLHVTIKFQTISSPYITILI